MQHPITPSFNFIITKTAWAYRLQLANVLAANGFPEISADYYILLETLWVTDNLSIGDLAKRTRKDSASVSRMVEGMSLRGLVKRVKSDSDSRFSNVFLTKKGFELETKLRAIVEEYHANAMRGLNPIEVKELVRMLEHVFGNVKS